MNQPQTTQQIESILTDVNNIIRSGVSKLLYDHTIHYLTSELEKCRIEMEYYKSELEKVKKQNELSSSKQENIVLKIEDIKTEIKNECEKPTIEKTVLAPKTVHNLVIVEDETCSSSVCSICCNENKEDDIGETDEEVEVQEEEEVKEEEVQEEEVEEEVEEEEVKEEEVQEEEVEEEVEEKEENDAEEEVFEIEIDDVTYYTENEENGNIYAVDTDGNPGNKIGYLKDGEPFFY
jgi:TATA-binding protein-associated factor Taf7